MKTTHIETHNVQVLRGAGTHFSFFCSYLALFSHCFRTVSAILREM